jgi:hypothetical protein
VSGPQALVQPDLFGDYDARQERDRIRAELDQARIDIQILEANLGQERELRALEREQHSVDTRTLFNAQHTELLLAAAVAERDALAAERDALAAKLNNLPATCPRCGETEPNAFLLMQNHGAEPGEDTIHGAARGEHLTYGDRCTAQDLTRNHIWGAVTRGDDEDLARSVDRGRELGLDTDAIIAQARQDGVTDER